MNKILGEFYFQSNISSPHLLLSSISSLLLLKRTPIYKKGVSLLLMKMTCYLVHERLAEVSLQLDNKN